MENFVVSARKYRPATFGTVVGQSAITSTLKNAIRNNQLAQAFLFCGPRGVGKTTCARILAKTINCMNPTADIEPCNECDSCTTFNGSASFNIHELDAASNNSVDDIRNLVDQVRIPPQVGKYKVYIIDEVHMLSPSAFNAFLKTLEEPPAYAKFILATTEKHKIIPTILSRCQIFDFKRITVDDIASHLQYVANQEVVTADPEALQFIAHKADGALRDALSVFDQMVNLGNRVITRQMVIENLNILDYDYYFRLLDYIRTGNYSDTLLLLNEIVDKGFDGQHFLIGLGDHLRNLLMSIDASTVRLIETGESIRKRFAHQAQSIPMQLLINALEIVNKNDITYRTSNHKRLSLEVALVQMCRLSGNMVMPAVQPAQVVAPTVQAAPAIAPTPSAPQVAVAANNQIETSSISVVPHSVKVAAEPEEKIDIILPQVNITTPEQAAPVIEKEAEQITDEIKNEVHESIPEPQEKAIPVQTHHVSSTSIKEITNAALRSKMVEDKPAEYRTEPFTLEQIRTSISVFAEANKHNSALLYASLTDYQPELHNDSAIVMTVKNNVLGKELNDRRTLLLEFVRNNLKNDTFTLIINIAEVPTEVKKYMTDTDKFRDMANQNPSLKKLTDQLNLELDI